jgi:hypothetical protein
MWKSSFARVVAMVNVGGESDEVSAKAVGEGEDSSVRKARALTWKERTARTPSRNSQPHLTLPLAIELKCDRMCIEAVFHAKDK